MVIDDTGTDAIIAPVEILEEELEARGMTQRELAQRMGRPVQTINEVIKGKRALTAPITPVMRTAPATATT